MDRIAHGSRQAQRRGEIQFPLAEDGNGRIVHISTISRESGSDYRCPFCRESLIARLGARNAHHFAHEKEVACARGIETALHRWAKQELPARGLIRLPALRVSTHHAHSTVHPETEVAYDRAVLEQRLDEIVPDLILYRGTAALLVEIAVTHRCDAIKKEKLQRLGFPAIEIDLSGYSLPADNAELEELVLRRASRDWLFHPDKAAALQALHDERARELERRERAIRATQAARFSRLAAERAIGMERARAFIAASPLRLEIAGLATADEREVYLDREVASFFNGRGADWTVTPHDLLDGATPRSYARDSNRGLQRVLSILGKTNSTGNVD